MIPNKELRRRIIEKAYEYKLPHSSSAFSCLDALAHIYENILGPEDTFILSKGHGAMALYAVLENQGKRPTWQMHPDYREEVGIAATTGSLGHGLPIAVGRALGKKYKGQGRVYVMMGDCEMSEGSNWEALTLANALEVNLTTLVDWNQRGVLGEISEYGLDGNKIAERLKAFGCRTEMLDGHDPHDLAKIGECNKGLQAYVLKTVRGKGIPVLEASKSHHYYWHLNVPHYHEALELLK